MKKKYIGIFIFFLILISISTVHAVPVDWFGRVTIDSNTTTDGAIVTAHINGSSSANATDTVGTPDSNYYLIHVECSAADNVNFKVFGVAVNESAQNCTGMSNELNLTMSTLADGNACTYNQGCTNSFCVHNICRSTSTYCGDGFCDTGESCSDDNSGCSSGFACTNGCVATTAGGGGAGPEAPPEEEGVTEAVVTIDSIAAGETATVIFENADELGVESITLKVINDVQNVQIGVTKQATKPSGVTTPPGVVNKYITITVTNLDPSDLESATINFKVEQTWISGNNIDKNTVILRRFTTQWDDLSTSLTSEDVSVVLYEAETPGLSVFAVTGEQITAQPPAPPEGPPTGGAVTPVPYETGLVIGIVILVIIILVALIIALSLRK